MNSSLLKSLSPLWFLIASSLALAAPVVVQPGGTAGYMYFPAQVSISTSGSSGSTGSGFAQVPPCNDLSIIGGFSPGANCLLPEGGLVKFAGIYGGNKILVTDFADDCASCKLQDPTSDTALTNYPSGSQTTDFAGATNTSYWGTGTGFARQACIDKPSVNTTLGSGWYVPAAGQLQILYNNRSAIGGFSSGYYWSSTENASSAAWLLNFSNGSWNNGANKHYTYYVRCVRSF